MNVQCQVYEFLQFCSDRLLTGGVLLLVPSILDVSKLYIALEQYSSARDGPSFLHYHIYNVSSDSRLKTQAYHHS
jgi:hypothetical protein